MVRARWAVAAQGTPGWGVCRATIALVSTPAGGGADAYPQSPPRRGAEDGAAPAAGAGGPGAVAAEALEGLGGCRGAPLADPVLAGGGADALDPALVFVGAGMIAGVGEAQHQGGGGFGLEGKVRQDVAHEGLVRQLPAEGAAVRGMVRRLRHRLAHEGRGADDAVQPGLVDHLQDRPRP